jgi:hypothetical protein
LKVLLVGKRTSHVFLRRIHNFALAIDWLVKSVIPKAAWPKVPDLIRFISLSVHDPVSLHDRQYLDFKLKTAKILFEA